MPRCKRCNHDHFNFQACPKPQGDVPMAGANPWGTPWSASPVRAVLPTGETASKTRRPASVEVVFSQPFRHRTGTLTTPPEWDDTPLEAA